MRVDKDFGIALALLNKIGVETVVIRDNVISIKHISTGLTIFYELGDTNEFAESKLDDVGLPVSQLNRVMKKKINKDMVELDLVDDPSGRFELLEIKRNGIVSTVYPTETNSISKQKTQISEDKIQFLTDNHLNVTKEEIFDITEDYSCDKVDLYVDENYDLRSIKFISKEDINEYSEKVIGDKEDIKPVRFSTDIFNALSKSKDKSFELYLAKNGEIYLLTALIYIEQKAFMVIAQNIEIGSLTLN